MALPNYGFYYWTANIRCLTFWSYFHNWSDCPSWVALELGSAKNFSVSALLGSKHPLPPNKPIDNPVVRHTLRGWAQFRRHFGLSDFWLSSPISANHLFQPYLLDPTFQEWQRLGIERFRDLFIDNSFVSFEQLTEKFNLPKSHFFRYLQIRHFIRCQIPSFPQTPDVMLMHFWIYSQPAGAWSLLSII